MRDFTFNDLVGGRCSVLDLPPEELARVRHGSWLVPFLPPLSVGEGEGVPVLIAGASVRTRAFEALGPFDALAEQYVREELADGREDARYMWGCHLYAALRMVDAEWWAVCQSCGASLRDSVLWLFHGYNGECQTDVPAEEERGWAHSQEVLGSLFL